MHLILLSINRSGFSLFCKRIVQSCAPIIYTSAEHNFRSKQLQSFDHNLSFIRQFVCTRKYASLFVNVGAMCLLVSFFKQNKNSYFIVLVTYIYYFCFLPEKLNTHVAMLFKGMDVLNVQVIDFYKYQIKANRFCSHQKVDSHMILYFEALSI